MLLSLPICAQTPHTINYSIEEGLPSSNVYFVFQDRDRYIWFATDVGVVKYNGRDFIHYNTDDGLADNEVFQIHQDNTGRIWFLTLNGKLSFYHNNRFYNEKNTPYLKSKVLSGMLQVFFNDSKGNIYISDRSSNLFRLDGQNRIWETAQLAWSPGYYADSKYIFNFFESDGRFRMFLNKGISDNGKRILLPAHPAVPDLVKTRTCRNGSVVYFNSDHIIYAISDKKLSRLFNIPENSAAVISVDYDRLGQFWIGTRKGVYLARRQNGRWIVRHLFPSLSITKVLLDNDGNYWLSSLESGVLLIPDMNVYSMDGLGNTKISMLDTSPDGELWAGGHKGDYYRFAPDSTYSYNIGMDDKNVVKDMLFTPDAFYVIGNQYAFVHSKKVRQTLKLGGNCLYDDGLGNIWMGSVLALKFPKETLNTGKWLAQLSRNYLDILKLSRRTNVIVKGEGRDLWLGTNLGLYKFRTDKPHDSIVNYTGKHEGLNANIEDLYFDRARKTLLLATNSQGIIMMRNDQIISHFTRRNNLSNNNCAAIAKAGANSYWIGTNTGLDKIYLAGGAYHIRNYNAILALKDRKINDIEVVGDTVYLATDNGILYFSQFQNFTSKARPGIRLTEFKVGGRSIPFGKKTVLQYNQNELTIAFDGISFLNSDQLKYHYKLEGADDFWFTTRNTQINYKALAPGDYRFRVYASDARNNKSRTSQIRFTINPPFWKTWPFVLVFLVLSLGILFFIWRMRLRKLERKFSFERKAIQAERDKAHLEKQMIELEQKALRLQMNPHFIFNALNTIKGYYAEGNDVKASNYISKFSKLLRMLLENTEQLIPLTKEIEMLQLYIGLTQIRYKNKFDFAIALDPELNPDDTAIPALLLQPMVENAIIHGLAPKKEKGQLTIGFHKKEQMLVCTVEDNGIGRKASQQAHREYISKATEITSERIALMRTENEHSTIAITDLENNGQPAGTRIVIAIPLTTIW